MTPNAKSSRPGRCRHAGRSQFGRIQLLLLLGAACFISLAADNGPSQKVLQQRRREIEQLSPAQKQRLADNRAYFEQLPAEEQERLRRLNAQINQQADAERLRAALARYAAWLDSLPRTEREKLQSLPADERLAHVRDLREQQKMLAWLNDVPTQDLTAMREMLADEVRQFQQWMKQLPEPDRKQLEALSTADRMKVFREEQQKLEWRRFMRVANAPLKPEDLRAFFSWLERYVDRYETQMIANLPDSVAEQLKKINDDQLRRRYVIFNTLRFGKGLPSPSQQEVQELRSQLSPEAVRLLESVDPSRRALLVQRWLKAALYARMRGSVRSRYKVSNEQLDQFAREKLSDSERARLSQLSGDEYYDALRREYYRKRFSGRSPWGHRRPGSSHGSDNHKRHGPRRDSRSIDRDQGEGRGDRDDG